MKLLVGLGNPGTKYKNTRHNVGFMFCDEFLLKNAESDNQSFHKESKFLGEVAHIKNITLLKPDTFMNDSGKSLCAISTFYKILPHDIFVVHDDLDIKLGEYKIQKGKGPKVHNGILSIEKELGTVAFWRVRIGVDNREPDNRIKGETYVLQKFTEEELQAVNNVFKEIIRDLDRHLLSK